MSRHKRHKVNTHSTIIQPRLSLCMIIKNEDKYLDGCLQSVQGIVDEIIIVDTGSSDNSIDIAKKYNAQVIPFTWVNDFSAARNESLKYATGDWILYLDADERLVQEQGVALRGLLGNPLASAYTLLIQGDHYMPTGVVKQVNAYPRLFRKHPAVRFEGKVHEQILPSINRLGMRIVASNIIINHLGYGEDYETVKKKCRRNIDLLREHLYQYPDDGYTRFQLGNSLTVVEDYENARSELVRTLEMPSISQSIRAATLNLLAEIDIRKGDYDYAIEHCNTSLKLAGYQIIARWYLAAAKLAIGDFLEAIDPLRGIIEILHDPRSAKKCEIAYDILLDESVVNFRLGICFEAIQKFTEASKFYFQAVLHNPQSDDALNSFIRMERIVDDPAEAIVQEENLYNKGIKKSSLILSLASNYWSLGNKTKAYELVREASYLFPSNPNVYSLEMRWKILEGNYTSAESIFNESQLQGVKSYDLYKTALEVALHRGDLNKALNYLEEITGTPEGNVSSVKDRIAKLRGKLEIVNAK